MHWAKVRTKFTKPLGWWYYKIMCEYGWQIRHIDGWKMYYYYLRKMCKEYNINLYGERI